MFAFLLLFTIVLSLTTILSELSENVSNKNELSWLVLILLWFSHFVYEWFHGQEYDILSESMLPKYKVGQSVRVVKCKEAPVINDVVAFKPPLKVREQYGDEPFVKRVLATEGQTIEILGNKTYINNELQIENYEFIPAEYHFGPVVVPENKLMCAGDNRPDSVDCHIWVNEWGDAGFVHVEDLIGKVVV